MLCAPTRARWLSQMPLQCPVMEQEPCPSSLMESLKASSTLLDIRCSHHLIIKYGLEQDLLLGNALLQMYGNCLLPDDVCACFDRLRQRNHISWNLVIKACASHALHIHDALRLFAAMQMEGVTPTKFALASVLSACCTSEAVVDGKLIHCLVVCQACELDVVIGTALIGMYRRFQSLEDAHATFKILPEQNAACWNVMASLISQLNNESASMSFLRDMQQHAVTPEKVTFLVAFDVCTCKGKIKEVKELHVWAKNSELYLNVMVTTALMKMYGQFGLLCDAKRLFEDMPVRDLVSWNALIAIYAQQDYGEAAVQIFEQMQCEGVQATKVTLISVLDACAGKVSGVLGKCIHIYTIVMGYNLDVVLGTSLVNMYGSCVSLQDAWHVLDRMPEKNIVSWNAMMGVCVQRGEGEMVLQFFERVLQDGIFPDNATFLMVSDACAKVSDLSKGKQMHTRLLASDSNLDVVLGSSLVSMYGVCNDVKSARLVFDSMNEHNSITFTNLLTVCADLGALTEGKWLHAYLIEREVELDVVINTALVNMYGKCGLLDTAWSIFLDMPERNSKSWNAMLAAYTQQGQGKRAVELIAVMAQSGIALDETSFVLIFSACSHSGLIDECCCFFLLMSRIYCISPVVDHYNCLLDMLGRAGRLDEAEAILRNMPLPPTRVSWSTLLGACQSQVDVERGAMIASHIFGLNPKNASAFVTLANMYAGVQDNPFPL
ncbi:hypothetical protein L7F22_046520 [Adiantum nelumboides]|nr:hypothetical protein [Adiantum nelumboides]